MTNKSLAYFIALIIYATGASGQEIDLPIIMTPQETHDCFMKKSKNNKTAGWILAGTGSALFVTGGIVALVNFSNSIFVKETSSTGSVIAVIGLSCAVASIPFFISASKNKKKANLSVSNQSVSLGYHRTQELYFPSLGLQINF